MRIRQALLAVAALLSTNSVYAQWPTPQSQMETLDRGVVVVPGQSGGRFVSWRLLGTDDANTTFDVLRDGTAIVRNLTQATSYLDPSGSATSTYQVVARVDGTVVETAEATQQWSDIYTSLQLDRPAGGTTASGDYTYTPNDMSVGDVDGDGEYELFVKWDPSNSKDNSQDGYTGNVIIDCYKLDGTKLWRIDLGKNIRAGAHYTQFMVYDFDGDGRAEMMCKTAPGSKDASGSYVNQAATDSNIKAADNTKEWLTSRGRMDGGQEYLTVFNGLNGKAIHTIAYMPNRNAALELSDAQGTFNWAVGKTDNHGYNRGDRYLAAVACLDGPDKPASGIFCRGYYSYAFIWAVDFNGTELKQKWLSDHRSNNAYTLYTWNEAGTRTKQSFSGCKPTNGGSKSGTMFSNGNHNLSVADVDGDGCDEIIWGSAALDHDGTLLYGTGYGHGDAIHLADHCPDRPGLEVFQIHEESPYGWDLHDARTGEIIFSADGSADNGRGIAGQFDANVRGSLFWSSNDGSARSAVTGEAVSTKHGTLNFRIFWDGDLQEELLDGNKIDKWNGNGTTRLYLNGKNLYDYNGSSTCNSTKNTPCLQADILGDWREEIILWSSNDNATINIFTTNTPTAYRVPTLMHDHVYRMGICWQNVAYNQPPHLGFYLPDYIANLESNDVETIDFSMLKAVMEQDYEQETDASTWIFTKNVERGDLTLQTGDSEHGNYIQFALPQKVNSTPVHTNITSGSFDSYTLLFDAAFSSGNTDGSEFVVATEGGNFNVPQKDVWFNYAAYNNNLHSLLHLAIPAKGTSAAFNYDDANIASVADGKWYSYYLKVDGEQRTVTYTVTSKATGATVASDTYALPAGTTSTRLQGFYYLAGRYYGYMNIDNIRVLVDRDTARTLPGDADGNDKVENADVIAVTDRLLGLPVKGFMQRNADIDEDGQVSIADLTRIIEIILNNR